MRAVITGCAGGIGGALCARFRAAGYDVSGLDIRDCSGACADHVTADLRELSDLQSIATRFPDIAVLINNAAVQRLGGTAEISTDDWSDTLAVNLTAPLLLTQVFLPALERSHGSVINIASIHASLTKPAFVAYATSKAALVGLTRSMAVDLGGRVRVNAICPAAVDTPMLRAGFEGREDAFAELSAAHPIGRIALPEDVAAIAVFLASDAAAFITGAVLSADGGIGARLHDPL